MRYGVELTCLKSFTILTPKSNNASATDKIVDAFGSNIKKLVGAEGGGTTANHNSFMNTISAWCRRAHIPLRGVRAALATAGRFRATYEKNGRS